ncbi:unnamed protein product [Caenorhabditis angaria]|uniref:Uncharacterized protein n=1 Tax=Caenorhabditis angaria TaxID=860376 RepID=A0A9P1I674_9PELO|nr:unnamed protein product [Caenorhabditis angaria]
MDDFIESVVITAKAIILIIISTFRNLLPMGVLPRKNVRGQTVLITGSGSGLGRLMSYEFGKLGAKLILWDVNEQGNLETAKNLESKGVQVTQFTES